MTTTIQPTTGTTTWNIDPAHSHVEFAVKHMMIATVKGRFAEVSGQVTVDEADPTSAQIHVTINAASIDTRQEQRDTHLRSADFLHAEQFPTITFTSTRIEPRGDDKFRVVGNLTIRGVTREVTLEASEEGRGRDPWGGERVGFHATGKLDRTQFGLVWNQALETGGILVGNDVRINIDVELVKAPE